MQLSDVWSERAVLAGILQHGSVSYYDTIDILNNDAFTSKSNKTLYSIIKYLFAQDQDSKIDYALLQSGAKSLGFHDILDDVDEQKYIRGLYSLPIEISNIRKAASKIRKLEITRNLTEKLELAKLELSQVTGDENINDILGKAEKPIFDFSDCLNSNEDCNPVLMGDGMQEYIQYLKDNPKDNIGIPTGYPLYDAAIGGGIRRGTVGLIGARTKVGKSTLANNIALYVSQNLNIPVLFLDTEMVIADQRHRALANIAKVDLNDIESGRFANNQQKTADIAKAGKTLSKLPYYHVSVVGKAIEEILGITRRWLMKCVGKDEYGITKDCLIIYDYLKLANTNDINKSVQEYQLLGFQISSLHNFCVTNSVPCLSFIQLNRDGINKETTDVASGSDRQLWICSHFCIFKHKSDEEIAQDGIMNGNRKMVFVIGRHGGGLDNNQYICMSMEGKYNRVREIGLNTDVQNNRDRGFVPSDNNTDLIDGCF